MSQTNVNIIYRNNRVFQAEKTVVISVYFSHGDIKATARRTATYLRLYNPRVDVTEKVWYADH